MLTKKIRYVHINFSILYCIFFHTGHYDSPTPTRVIHCAGFRNNVLILISFFSRSFSNKVRKFSVPLPVPPTFTSLISLAIEAHYAFDELFYEKVRNKRKKIFFSFLLIFNKSMQISYAFKACKILI